MQEPEFDSGPSPREIRSWVEFCCWFTLFLAPILIWWNGPSVSDDQAVVRTGLIVVSAIGAFGLRFYALLFDRNK